MVSKATNARAMPKPIVYLFALVLAVGALPMPYGYYVFLRLIACAGFAFAAYVVVRRKHKVLPWVYGGLAIVFNPAVRVIFPKSVWAAVDIAAALLLVATASHITAGSGETR